MSQPSKRQQRSTTPDESSRRERRDRRPSAKQRQLDEAEEAAKSRKTQKRPAAESSENGETGGTSRKKSRQSHGNNSETSMFTTAQNVTSSKPNQVPFKNLIKRTGKVPSGAAQASKRSEQQQQRPSRPVVRHLESSPPPRSTRVARRSELSVLPPPKSVPRRSEPPPPATHKRYGTAHRSEQRQVVQVASTARQVYSSSNMQSRDTGETQRRPRNTGRAPPLSDDEETAPKDRHHRGPQADSPEPLSRDVDERSDTGNGFNGDPQFDNEQSDDEHLPSQFVYDAADFQDEDDEEYLSQHDDDQPVERVPSSPRSSSPNLRRSISPRDVDDDDHQELSKTPVDMEDDEGSRSEGSESGSTNGGIACPKPVGAPSKHGPRAKDYDADVKAVLNLANSLFRCRVSTIDAFPSDLIEEQWAQVCWGEACKTLDVNYAADRGVIKIITARTSQLRGELKSKVRPLVESLYGFNGSSAKKAIRENRDKAAALTSDSLFAYKDPALDRPQGADAEGIYRHPIIQKAINATWFMNRSDEGILYKEYFSPAISIGMMALILTAVQCCIDEWGTGKRSGVSFYENEYKPVYLSHKANLLAFDDLCDDAHSLLLKLRKKLYKEARFHSGAEDTERTAVTLSHDALTRALQQAMDAGDDDDDA